MTVTENTKYILGTVGLALIALTYAAYSYSEEIMGLFAPEPAKEVHVHAGFLFKVNGQKVDLTAERYQSSALDAKHRYFHFHDGIDTMLHRHAEGITLGDFLSSIGITLTKDCITLDTGEQYCEDGDNVFRMYVNGEVNDDPASYVIEEEDEVLLYYGKADSSDIPLFIDEVSDEACIYSGTCPERGEPPFETCGITCEVTS